MVKDYCTRNILRELARCLAIFPNVHTLKLDLSITAVASLEQYITYGFGRHKSLPQICSIMLPRNCNALLKYVPGVRYVHFKEQEQTHFESWFLDFAACCPLLENICLSIPLYITVL
jgi:hypothetical protein